MVGDPAIGRLADLTRIQKGDRVLVIQCGSGTEAVGLATHTHCRVVAVDQSADEIRWAQEAVAEDSDLSLEFQQVSLMDLPFPDGSFSHVWSRSQLTSRHRAQIHAEMLRVLQDRGRILIEDVVADDEVDHYANSLSARDVMLDHVEHLSDPEGPVLFCGEKVTDRLEWSYEEGSVRAKYDAWSPVYETDPGRKSRNSPIRGAMLLARNLEDHSAPVLDAGAGTGMVGEELARLGFTNLTAVDLSSGMLAVARTKGIYERLHHWDLSEVAAPWPEKRFAAIIAVGVFTFSHAPPSALLNLDRFLQVRGKFVLTVREDYQNDFQPFVEVMDRLDWAELDREPYQLAEGDLMLAICFEKRS